MGTKMLSASKSRRKYSLDKISCSDDKLFTIGQMYKSKTTDCELKRLVDHPLTPSIVKIRRPSWSGAKFVPAAKHYCY